MKQRIITSILILAVVLPPLYLGGYALEALILAFVAIAAYEIITVALKENPIFLYLMTLALILFLGFASAEMILFGLVIMMLIFFSIAIFNSKYTIENCAYIMVMILIMALTVQAIHYVYTFSNLVMLYILVATYLTDTGAYFAGRFFGKHKLNERISPKKTIEGSIGGFLLGAIGSFVFGIATLQNILPVALLLVLSTVMSIIGQIGDLAFSAIKRHYEVKDFGLIFPGHGGVLDRIDSLIFNLLIFLACIQFTQVYFVALLG